MSDEKKPMFRHESVSAETLEELAKKLQDARNRLHEEGYTTHIEAVHEWLRDGFGYMIHSEIKTTNPFSGMGMVVDLPGQENGSNTTDASHRDHLSEKTRNFVQSALDKVRGPRWSDAVNEFPAIVANIMTSYSVADISEIIEDLEKEVKARGEEHTIRCVELRALHVAAKTLSEHKRLNLQ